MRLSSLLIDGQWLHFPGAFLHIIGYVCVLLASRAGYCTLEEVRISLRVGRLLNATIGLSGNILALSLLVWSMFQWLLNHLFMSGSMVLYCVTIMGRLLVGFSSMSNRSVCLKDCACFANLFRMATGYPLSA